MEMNYTKNEIMELVNLKKSDPDKYKSYIETLKEIKNIIG